MIHPDDPIYQKRLSILCVAPEIKKSKTQIFSRPAKWSDFSLGDFATILSRILQEPLATEWTLKLSTGKYHVSIRDPEEDDRWELPAPMPVRIVRRPVFVKQPKRKKKNPVRMIVRDDVNKPNQA